MTVLSFDPSYKNTGVAVAEDGNLIYCRSFELKKFGIDSKFNLVKRVYLRELARALTKRYKPDIVTVEAVRLFSGGFINYETIGALYGLCHAVSEGAFPTETISISTQSFKSKILGDKSAEKDVAVEYVKNLGFDVDHDAAEAGCMALYMFIKNPKFRSVK